MAGEKKYSYIKKPFAKNGFYCFALALFSCLLLAGTLFSAFSTVGESGMNAGAVGLGSMLAAAMSLWFMRLSFGETGKNYLFAKIGGIFSGLLLLLWIGILAAGTIA